MIGQIIASTCGVYSIKSDDRVFQAKPRGSLKSKIGRLYVGDYVNFNADSCTIEDVVTRYNVLKRPPIANVDQMLIVVSLIKPEFSYELVFKYLTYCSMHNLNAKIIVTKIDICEDKQLIEEIKKTFEMLKIETFFVSNKSKIGIDKLSRIFEGKITCLMGQSGVGKSSLLNSIDNSFDREIGEYSQALGRGKHETKEVVLLEFGRGYIADTPGFSSLELGLYKEDLAQFFPGFNNIINCYYTNCLHISENRCAIKEMVDNGTYPMIAYETYLKLSKEALAKNKRYTK